MDDGNNTIFVCLQSIPETLGHHQLQGLNIFSFWQQFANPSHVTSNKKKKTTKNNKINKGICKSGVSQLLIHVKIHTQYITVNMDSQKRSAMKFTRMH